jgi:hypothetical protein
MDPTPTPLRRRGPTPRALTLDKLEQVEQLTRRGWSVLDACSAVGLDTQTWYRHTRRLVTAQQLEADVLAILQALVHKVAA